jgi:hypothetical protein
MPKPLAFNRKSCISSVHSSAMASFSRENSRDGDRSAEDTEKPKRKLSTTTEASTPGEGADENGSPSLQQRSRSTSADQHDTKYEAQPVITAATERLEDREKPHSQPESTTLNQQLYQQVREAVIADIIEHLLESQRSYEPTPSSVPNNAFPSRSSNNGGISLNRWPKEDLKDLRRFYDLGKSWSSQNIQRPFLSADGPLIGHNRHLSAIPEDLSSKSPSKTPRMVEVVRPMVHSDDPCSMHTDDLNDRAYIPELKWKDLPKWPGFLKTWPPFLWTCIQDSFSTNPYKLHPAIYLAMGTALLWCILTKCVLILMALQELIDHNGPGEWNKEQEAEARRLTDSTVSILPYVVQLVLFLFPPLLASTA